MEAVDHGLQLVDRGRRGPGGVGEETGAERQARGPVRREAGEGAVERLPQLGAAAEGAHRAQRVERFDEGVVGGVVPSGLGGDCSRQQAVGGIDVAFPVEEQEGGCDRGLERSAPTGVGLSGVDEQARGVTQLAGDVGADVGRFGQPPAPVGAPRAEVGGPEQGRHRARGVAPPEGTPAGLLEQAGDMLVGFDGGVGQMPGVALRLIDQRLGQGTVGVATFAVSRQLHHGRAHEGVAEDQPTGAVVDRGQAGTLGPRQTFEAAAPPGGPQRPQIAGAVQRTEQEHPPGVGRHRRDPGLVEPLQPPADRQHRGQDTGRTEPSVQRRRELHERQRVSLRFGQDAPTDLRGQGREPGIQEAGGGLVVERRQLLRRQPVSREEALGRGPRGGDEPDPAPGQAAGHEPQHGRAGPVEPLGVVDDQQQRPRLRRLA